jgi:hypothetical protein
MAHRCKLALFRGAGWWRRRRRGFAGGGVELRWRRREIGPLGRTRDAAGGRIGQWRQESPQHGCHGGQFAAGPRPVGDLTRI